MITLEDRKKRLKEYIENIEQLGADARFQDDYENYDILKTQFDSIEWWARKANRELIKIQILENAKLEEQRNEKTS
jgi:hypothetical protein